MQQKNYYRILQIDTNCNADAIKKAYRKLALELHPDVNKTDETAAHKFTTIKEAYDVLSNPEKRSKYHESFFFTNLQKQPIDLNELLIIANKIGEYIKHSNIFKIDYFLISANLQELLQQNNLLIATTNQSNLKDKLQQVLLNIIKILPYDDVVKFYSTITQLFPSTTTNYLQLIAQKKKTMLWEKYAMAIAILITLALCFMIAFLA